MEPLPDFPLVILTVSQLFRTRASASPAPSKRLSEPLGGETCCALGLRPVRIQSHVRCSPKHLETLHLGSDLCESVDFKTPHCKIIPLRHNHQHRRVEDSA